MASDNKAPEIGSVSLSTTNVDTNKASTRTIDVTFNNLTDDISGIDGAYISYKSPSGNNYVGDWASVNASEVLSKSALITEIQFHEYAESGDWTFNYMYVSDKAGNTRYYYRNDLDNIPSDISVTGKSDNSAPEIGSVSLSTTNVDTNKASTRTIDVTFNNLTDDISGIDGAYISYKSPSGNNYVGDWASVNASEVLSKSALITEIQFHEYAESGDWTFNYMYVSDKAGNTRYYYRNDLDNIPSDISVTGKSDNSAPEIGSVSLSTTNVDTNKASTRTIDVTFNNLTDDISGIDGAYISYKSPSGNNYVGDWASVNASEVLSKSALITEIQFHEYAESGDWTFNYMYVSDKAGNTRYYYRNDLDNIPSDISVGDGTTTTNTFIRNSSFYISVDGPSWEEAEEKAVELGGHLVTINDSAENDWLVSQYYGSGKLSETLNNKNVWIGFTDKNIEGTWEWISGESVDYINWASDEPNANHPQGLDDYAGMGLIDYQSWRKLGDWVDAHNDPLSISVGIAEVPLSYFAITDLTITEGDSGTVTISRTGGTKSTQTLTLTSSNGTATAGSDYTAVDQTISFASGETSKTVTISSTSDNSSESNETFNLTLAASSTDTVPAQISDSISVVTIKNDDAIIKGSSFYKLIKVESDRNATPSDGNPSWWSWDFTSKTNYRDGLIQKAKDIGGDLVTINDDQELTFLRSSFGGTEDNWLQSYAYNSIGELSRLLIDWDKDDPAPEAINALDQYWGYDNSKFLLPWGGQYNGGQYNEGDGNILYGDLTYGHAPEHVIAEVPLSYFSISDLTIEEGESGTVTISRTGGSKTAQTLSLTSSNDSASAGSDYTAVDQTISFASGETSKTVTISSTEDSSVELDETFTLSITASDSDTVPAKITDGTATVTITNDDTNTDTTAPEITGPNGNITSSTGSGITSSYVSINEKTSFVYAFTANETVTWDFDDSSLYGTGGEDVSNFTIDASTGTLSFKSSPDFDNPADTNSDNDYVVVVRATDTAGNKSLQPLTVTVNDVKESTLLIKGPSGDPGESSATKAILENKTDVYTFTANDFVTWSLSGGTDKNLFSINSSTGALTFNSAPDYESPTDSNKDNSYVVNVTATDYFTNSVEQTVTVSIADIDELTSSPIYSIYTDINVPQENYLLTTTAQTSNVAAGTKLYWSLSGTNINLADFSSGSMNGEGTVGSDGSFSFQHLLANDGLTEGYETIDIKLFSDNSLSTQLGITKSILIRDSAITEQIAELDTQLNTIKSLLTIGQEYSLSNIRDYDGNLHATTSTVSTTVSSSYKYQGLLDVNTDGTKEAIYTNKESGRWVTASVDSTTGLTDYSDYGKEGTTRIVGIYIDPLVQSGEVIKDSDFDSQRRFQNDLEIDNLLVKTAGDFDGDGFQEVYWKTADSTAYLRALMHDDGNIQYANYQSESQMTEYLTANGFSSTVSEIIS